MSPRTSARFASADRRAQSGHVLIGSAAPRAFDSATDRTKHDAEHRHTTIEATSAFTIPL